VGVLVGVTVIASVIVTMEYRKHLVPPVTTPITRTNVSSLGLVWASSTGTSVDTEPVVASNGRLFVVSEQRLTVFSGSCSRTGPRCEPLWSASLPVSNAGFWWGGPSVADGRVYVGTGQLVEAFSTSCDSNCSPVWRADPHGTSVSSAPVVADGVVYVASDTNTDAGCDFGSGPCKKGRLYAFPETCSTDPCTPLWFAELPHRFVGATPAVGGGAVYVGSADGTLEAFPVNCPRRVDAPCRPRWQASLPGGQQSESVGPLVTPLRENHGVLFAASGTRLYAFRTDCMRPGVSCRPLWTGVANSTIDDFKIAGGDVYVTSTTPYPIPTPPSGDTLTVFRESCGTSGKSCKPLWRMSGLSADANVTVDNGLIFVGTLGSKVSAFGADCGLDGGVCRSLWSRTLPSSAAGTPAVSHGYLFYASETGGVYAFAQNGSATMPLAAIPRPNKLSTGTLAFYLALFVALGMVAILRHRRRQGVIQP
jgi:outer membrane protein assembly factor BamB